MSELPMQCAWCGRLYDAAGTIGPASSTLLHQASHGLCPACLSTLLHKESERQATAGNLDRALRVELQRLWLLTVLMVRRRQAIVARVRQIIERSRALVVRSQEIRERSSVKH